MIQLGIAWLLLAVAYGQGNEHLTPQFDAASYKFTVNEIMAVGSKVFTVEAKAYLTQQRQQLVDVVYSVDSRVFTFRDENKGDVYLQQKLDFDADIDRKPITLKVMAVNKLFPQYSGTSSITITVGDDNDIKPSFDSDLYSKLFPEDTPIGTTLFFFNVTDADTVNDRLTVTCDPKNVLPDYKEDCNKLDLQLIFRTNVEYRGAIVLKENFNYEVTDIHRISMRAFDGKNNVWITVEAKVSDIQDTPPKWTRLPLIVRNETVPRGEILDYVRAEDGDTNLKRPVRYELLKTNDASTKFSLDPVSGNITNLVELDRETILFQNGFVELDIIARELDEVSGDLGNASINSTRERIRIEVLDANDMAPTFDQTEYVVDLLENTPNDTPLKNMIFTVTDDDQGDNAYFSYFLTNNNDEFKVSTASDRDPFQRSTSRIVVKNTSLIDYDKGPRQYVFYIVARETRTNPQLSSSAKVTVNIIDVNDNTPLFNPQEINATIKETAPGGTIVTVLKVIDPDGGSFGKAGVVFEMTADGQNLFFLNQSNNHVIVQNCPTPGLRFCIDFEEKRKYVLAVSAKDNFGIQPFRKATTTLTINILDVNDMAPEFVPGNNYTSYIREETVVPDPPVKVEVIDLDTVGGPPRFSILGGIDSQYWVIGETTGIVTARQKINFDFTQNRRGFFEFQVNVTDGINRATANVKINVIDTNNFPPVFIGAYDTTIPESTLGDVAVISVTATDADSPTSPNGLFNYYILNGADGKFRINSDNGTISTMPSVTFDHKIKNIYLLTVMARDQGTPPRSSTAPVTIRIKDVNNKDPYFTPTIQQEDVYENVNLDFSVYRVRATDPDDGAVLKYYFTEPKSALNSQGRPVDRNQYDFSNLFRMEEGTGIVRTNGKLDRDETTIVNYTMTVVDTSATPFQTGHGTLLINVLEYNDQAPTFINIRNISIEEEQSFGAFVVRLQATDEDDEVTEYQLTKDPHNFFSINFQTGSVTIRNRIDFEKIERTWFEATAFDNGSPLRLSATATVYIDILNINDNSPIFKQSAYEARIPEHSKSGTYVTTVSATDIDKGDFGVVRYTIIDPLNRFSIDEISGEIKVVDGSALDRETIGDVDIQVTAYDSPLSEPVRRYSTVTVYIYLDDINDNPPKFADLLYETTIIETIPIDTRILKVTASDADIGPYGLVSYSKINGSGDPDNYFKVSPRSGYILVNKSLFKKIGVYNFKLLARDEDGKGPFNATANVKITVRQVSNSYPVWVSPPDANMTVEVLESQYRGMFIYHVHANDTDSGDNGKVDYGFYYNGQHTVTTPEFRINSITGVIRAQIVYDRELVDRYTLLLTAKDNGKPGLETTRFLTIVIVDVNDNKPLFPQAADGSAIPVEVQIPEDTSIGFIITRLQATDKDLDLYSRIYYYIISGNEKGIFSIDRDTGELRLANKLDRESQSIFYLDVEATNNVSDYRVITDRRRRAADASIVTVKILVGNTNDKSPVFTKTLYHGCVSTRSSVGQSIVQVEAVDEDSAEDVRYRILSGNTDTVFQINEASGMISNRVLMQNTNQKVYEMKVEARDSSLQDSTDVVIFVTQPEDSVTLVLKQPTSEVRLFIEQIQAKMEEFKDENGNPVFKFVCFSGINDHVLDSGGKSLWTDVTMSAVCENCQNSKYSVFHGTALLDKLNLLWAENRDIFDLLYIHEMKLTTDNEPKLNRTPTMVVMIIIIVLIACSLIFILVACYCIKRSPSNREKKLLIENKRVDDFDEPPIKVQGVNPVYDNRGYEPDPTVPYATVQKFSRPQYPEPEPDPAVFDSPPPQDDAIVPVFFPDNASQSSHSTVSETRIVTEVVDDNSNGRVSPEPQREDDFRIETSVM